VKLNTKTCRYGSEVVLVMLLSSKPFVMSRKNELPLLVTSQLFIQVAHHTYQRLHAF